ncbi:Heavy metal-associated isoprenylated plant protein 15 [Cardamine amara subsp. amara]|uniref:Heavy metal-associated isoprenylated plant protein 15 n=1 Tax=Cardamine amara subsp. amara TaxID=228776 RepID=A0ABD1B6F6_CARAN
MVVMIDVHDDRSKDRVLRTVASCSGLTTITMDSKDGKLTVIGDFDEMKILSKLKRRWNSAKMATFGSYDAKKEAETAAAAEKKKKEESERQGLEALNRPHREIPIYYPPHHRTVVCDHGYYNGCVIS